jgi:hypothetical protein
MSIELISQIIENAFNVDFKMMFAVIFRTAIVTLLIVFVIKWLGNKGLGQLSTIELIIILGLGNAVSEPMLNPTRDVYTSRIYGYYYSNSNIQNV